MTSYWLSEPHAPLPAVRLDGAADVVVVGAGVTGCTAALRLAQAGMRVLLCDAREVAGGASGRNGGFALRGAPAPFDVTSASIGEQAAGTMTAWTERALDTIEALAGDAFRRVGSLRIAVDDEERDELRTEYEALVAAGFATEWVEDFEQPVAGRFTGAIRHGPDGVLQPARWVRRLARLAGGAGVEIREHSRVASLDELDGASVVVCTDGY
ncbi:MAG: NAD(P)/FAD-dependent oxidoreductase, partial [Gaiellaceae bacterium]